MCFEDQHEAKPTIRNVARERDYSTAQTKHWAGWNSCPGHRKQPLQLCCPGMDWWSSLFTRGWCEEQLGVVYDFGAPWIVQCAVTPGTIILWICKGSVGKGKACVRRWAGRQVTLLFHPLPTKADEELQKTLSSSTPFRIAFGSVKQAARGQPLQIWLLVKKSGLFTGRLSFFKDILKYMGKTTTTTSTTTKLKKIACHMLLAEKERSLSIIFAHALKTSAGEESL